MTHTSETASRGLGAWTIDQRDFAQLVETYRRELQVHCYRLLGSVQDAEDMVQETLLRAWRGRRTYQGRASLRPWLYKIATNVCLSALSRRPRRILPPALGAAADPRQAPDPPITESIWIEPYPDLLLPEHDGSPEAAYVRRERVTLAFVAALQTLPPRQRAVLILRDVLEFRARETAPLLGLTVSAVNSALHRARASLARVHGRRGEDAPADGAEDGPADGAMEEAQRRLLERYVHAWEAADVAEFIALLREDAKLAMPPSPSWYVGREAIRTFVGSWVLQAAGFQRWRLLPTQANGGPAMGLYRRETTGPYQAFGIQTLTLDGIHLAEITTFILPSLFSRFALPPSLPR